MNTSSTGYLLLIGALLLLPAGCAVIETARLRANMNAAYAAGEYEKAIYFQEQVISISGKASGVNEAGLAMNLNDLAVLYMMAGRYSEAEPLYKRALTMRETALGPEHVDTALSLNTLGQLYQTTGRYPEAEPLYKRALEIREKKFGPDHAVTATSFSNLAVLYYKTGRYPEAEAMMKRTITALEKAKGKDSHDAAIALNNLGELYRQTKRYAEAEAIYKKTIAIFDKSLGPDHPNTATAHNNLAILYNLTDRPDDAERECKRCIESLEKTLGPDHPELATSLNNLAFMYLKAGQYKEAEPLFKRSLAIIERSLGPDHPNTAVILSNLALYSAATDDYGTAHRYFVKSQSVVDRNRETVFTLFNDSEKLVWMNQKEGSIGGLLDLTARHRAADRQSVVDAFDAWVRWKGAVLESQGRYYEALSRSGDPAVQKQFAELTRVRRELARLQMTKPGKDFEERLRKIDSLTTERDGLEADLSRLSKEFSLEKASGRADTSRIAALLPPNAAYIDYARITPYDFKALKPKTPRYLVFLLLPGKETVVKLFDLAPAENVDRLVQKYRREMGSVAETGKPPKKEELARIARELHAILIAPFSIALTDKEKLIISPDGSLNLIAFEALTTPDSGYLIEQHEISYAGAGRDIVRFGDETRAEYSAHLFADPDYNLDTKENNASTAKPPHAAPYRSMISRDASRLHFMPLPDTKQEADSIEKLLKSMGYEVSNYQNNRALEELLFAEPPRILHLATHGYFLPDEEAAARQPSAGMIDEGLKQTLNSENPMLRSGIALAGANTSLKAGKDDGVITAEKILGLRLRGTDLVVLSACETGVGEVKNGEGVFGLKRAFILSGAKTLVMSLWSVPSAETTELMTGFYTRLAGSVTAGKALREAKLAMMKKRPNPFFWAAFIMNGR